MLSHVHIICCLIKILLYSKLTMKTNTNVHVTVTVSFSSLYLYTIEKKQLLLDSTCNYQEPQNGFRLGLLVSRNGLVQVGQPRRSVYFSASM